MVRRLIFFSVAVRVARARTSEYGSGQCADVMPNASACQALIAGNSFDRGSLTAPNCGCTVRAQTGSFVGNSLVSRACCALLPSVFGRAVAAASKPKTAVDPAAAKSQQRSCDNESNSHKREECKDRWHRPKSVPSALEECWTSQASDTQRHLGFGGVTDAEVGAVGMVEGERAYARFRVHHHAFG